MRAENSEGGTVLECVAHGHAIGVCQIVEAATRVVKWSLVKGNPHAYDLENSGVNMPRADAKAAARSIKNPWTVPASSSSHKANALRSLPTQGTLAKFGQPNPEML